jgi:hypothetical protein
VVVQEVEVWRFILLWVAELIPSIMSIFGCVSWDSFTCYLPPTDACEDMRWDGTHFSLNRPRLLSKTPKRRPHATYTRHGLDIQDEQALVVVLVALELHAFAPGSTGVVQRLLGIDTEHHVVANDLVQPRVLGDALGDVVDEAVVEILSGEVECIEPVLASVHFLLGVLGCEGGGGEDGTDADEE